MKTLMLPDGMTYVTDGSVVVISRFPNTKWVVHYGWYTHKGNQSMGWYFSSIPSQTTIPVSDEDLVGLQVVSGGCPCPPTPPFPPSPSPPPGPQPPCPHTPEYTIEKDQYLQQAFISVENRSDRDALNALGDVPDGKIVRVNDDVDGETRYYSWNRATGKWDVETFGSDFDGYTKDEADAKFATKTSVSQEVTKQIDALNIDEKINDAVKSADIPGLVSKEIDDANIPKLVKDTIAGDETIREVVKTAAEEIIPPIVDGQLDQVKQDITEIKQSIVNSNWEPLLQTNP